MKLKDKLNEFKNNNIIKNSTPCDKATQLEIRLKNLHKHIFFEKNVRFNSEIMAGPKGVFLGAHSYMNAGGYITDNTFIGRYCSIGRRVSLGAGMHRLNTVSSFPFRHTTKATSYNTNDPLFIPENKKFSDQTIIENDVWIGDGSVILKGVHIGTGAVVGANALVTQDVPNHAIAGGVPSKLIRSRFEPSLSKALLASEWWENDRADLESLPLLNVYEFLEQLNYLKIKTIFKTFTIA